MERHPFILSPKRSALVLVDLQENLLKAMEPRSLKECLINVQKLIALAKTLQVPILMTEQYPEGIGRTVEEIAEAVPECKPLEKNTFSAGVNQVTLEAISATQATGLVLAGAEAHVCVLQTALDLLHQGYRCHVVEDAVISRREENRRAGVELARQAGAVIKTTEMVCFEMLERAGTEEFKAMLKWIK